MSGVQVDFYIIKGPFRKITTTHVAARGGRSRGVARCGESKRQLLLRTPIA